jgi:hypothetical protein
MGIEEEVEAKGIDNIFNEMVAKLPNLEKERTIQV